MNKKGVNDMLRSVGVMAMFVLFINGCSAYRNDSLERMKAFPEHYAQFDAQVAWGVKSDDSSTVIEGAVKNIRYYEMTGLEVWVYTVDATGKEVHRGVDFIHRLGENEVGSFAIKIPRTASGTRLQFLYSYLGFNADSESADGLSWFQAFEGKVP